MANEQAPSFVVPFLDQPQRAICEQDRLYQSFTLHTLLYIASGTGEVHPSIPDTTNGTAIGLPRNGQGWLTGGQWGIIMAVPFVVSGDGGDLPQDQNGCRTAWAIVQNVRYNSS